MTVRTAPSSPPRRSAAVLAALVALCVLLSGIAPSVSRALAATAAAGLHDLCVSVPDEGPQGPVGHHGDADDVACALCAVHGGSHAAPARATPAPPPSTATQGVVATVRGGPAPADRWIAAAPRGPPAAAPRPA